MKIKHNDFTYCYSKYDEDLCRNCMRNLQLYENTNLEKDFYVYEKPFIENNNCENFMDYSKYFDIQENKIQKLKDENKKLKERIKNIWFLLEE